MAGCAVSRTSLRRERMNALASTDREDCESLRVDLSPPKVAIPRGKRCAVMSSDAALLTPPSSLLSSLLEAMDMRASSTPLTRASTPLSSSPLPSANAVSSFVCFKGRLVWPSLSSSPSSSPPASLLLLLRPTPLLVPLPSTWTLDVGSPPSPAAATIHAGRLLLLPCWGAAADEATGVGGAGGKSAAPAFEGRGLSIPS
mmetsp:Transcript_65872/g.113240  ORF Transcript_65872/g.113240 Transcript_65872/m.113240 type:complete len:200 (-) Transcript_65872:224-823(-)